MSHIRKSTVIPIQARGAKIPDAADRKRAERARRRAAGQVAITVHVDERHRRAVRTLEAVLNAGGELAARLVRYIDILADKLPARRRARMRLPRVTPDAARAAVSNILRMATHRRAA